LDWTCESPVEFPNILYDDFNTRRAPTLATAAYSERIICHDTEALRILRNGRRAIEPDGTLLLVEGISNASNQQNPGDFMDVVMLTLTGGRERTESDFRSFASVRGFLT
jgi:hypothetical protein